MSVPKEHNQSYGLVFQNIDKIVTFLYSRFTVMMSSAFRQPVKSLRSEFAMITENIYHMQEPQLNFYTSPGL